MNGRLFLNIAFCQCAEHSASNKNKRVICKKSYCDAALMSTAKRHTPRIAVLGSVHMDLIARAPTLPEKGHSVIGHAFTIAPGGKGGNQACQCAMMGAETFMISSLGDDLFGRELLAALQAKNVNTDHVLIDGTNATGTSTVLSAHDGYSSVIFPGAAAQLSHSYINSALAKCGRLDALILQLELPLALVAHAAKRAYELAIPVVLNYSPAPAKKPNNLISHVSTLVLNEHEAEAFGALETFSGQIILTSGSNGSRALSKAGVIEQPTFKADVVDTVGAGDAFLGTLITKLAEGAAMAEAMRSAAAAGAIAVSRSGAYAALPSRAEVADFLKSNP